MSKNFYNLIILMSITKGICSSPTEDDLTLRQPTQTVQNTLQKGELTMFDEICAFLTTNRVHYQTVEHTESTSSAMLVEILSRSTGYPIDLGQGAKSMLTVASAADKTSTSEIYTLVVLPGDESLDLKALAALLGTSAKKTKLASPKEVEELTGCAVGTVPPFTLFPNKEIALWVDQSLIHKNRNRDIFFTPGCLNKSVFLKPTDFLNITQARLVDVIKKAAIASMK